jgi:hypothetical protein
MRKRASDLLDGAVDGAVANTHGRLLSHVETDLRGYPGREFRVQLPENFVMHAKIFLVRQRLYQVVVVTTTGRAFRPEVFTFLESFRLAE